MSIDSERVISGLRLSSAVETCVERLALLACVTTDLQSEELSERLEQEIEKIISSQRQYEEQYKQLIIRRAELKAISNKKRTMENEQEIQKVAGKLQAATKALCRNLQDNPNLEGNLEKIAQDRSQLENLLAKTITDLQLGHFEVLQTRVEKDQARLDHQRSVRERERVLAEEVTSLKKQMQEEKSSFEEEVVSKNRLLAQLKEELHELKARTAIETKYLVKEAEARSSCVERSCEDDIAKLTRNLDRLNTKANIEKRASSLMDEFLKRKIQRMGQACDDWNMKFDTDSADIQNRLENMRVTREQDLVRLKEMEDAYKADVDRREEQRKEEERQRELQRIQAEERARQEEASLLLQCMYRRHLAKVTVDDIKNPKKKKGKGGKGGKGKKKK